MLKDLNFACHFDFVLLFRVLYDPVSLNEKNSKQSPNTLTTPSCHFINTSHYWHLEY